MLERYRLNTGILRPYLLIHTQKLIRVYQSNHIDKEQPILRPSRGCGTFDCSGVFAKAKLRISCVILNQQGWMHRTNTIGASPKHDLEPRLDCKEQFPDIENGDSEERKSVIARIANQLPHDMHQVTRQAINADQDVQRKSPRSQSSGLAPLPPQR